MRTSSTGMGLAVETQEPIYLPQTDEIMRFEAAYRARLPVMIKGPTGCGKTRFVEHMAWRLAKPLVTVSCNEDMTASDLIGRYLLDAQGTRWLDGPLTQAVRQGAICYLDEVVEARADTTVVIHALTDHRRAMTIDKTGEQLKAHSDFQLVISYNPGYQSLMKDLKPSTKQRFVAMDFEYPQAQQEAQIIASQTTLALDDAKRLVQIAQAARALKGQGLVEGISTRLLVYAGQLMAQGIKPLVACQMALVQPITDDAQVRLSLQQLIASVWPADA